MKIIKRLWRRTQFAQLPSFHTNLLQCRPVDCLLDCCRCSRSKKCYPSVEDFFVCFVVYFLFFGCKIFILCMTHALGFFPGICEVGFLSELNWCLFSKLKSSLSHESPSHSFESNFVHFKCTVHVAPKLLFWDVVNITEV